MAAPGLVVVGASLAGLRAVEAARAAGFTGSLTLVGAEEHLPYDRPPLSKALLDSAIDPIHPPYRSESELADLGVTLRLGAPATGLDPDADEVLLGDGRLPFTALVVATGSTPRTLPLSPLPGVHVLRTIDDALAVRQALDAGASTVVVGGGFIGSEVASAARARGLPVTIVEAADVPLVRAVGARLGSVCSALHEQNGTQVRLGTSVVELRGDARVQEVVLSDGTLLAADLVVVGIGADPATGWLDGSGVEVANGVLCDATLRSSRAGVWAAGDIARWRNALFGTSMRLEHWTSAAEQGALAARNALDPAAAKEYSTVPYFWSDWYGRRLQMVGVAADDVELFGAPGDPTWVALYRRGDLLCGALTLDLPGRIMKLRRLIAGGGSYDDALALAGVHADARSAGLPLPTLIHAGLRS